jgi:hypothetical protein
MQYSIESRNYLYSFPFDKDMKDLYVFFTVEKSCLGLYAGAGLLLQRFYYVHCNRNKETFNI